MYHHACVLFGTIPAPWIKGSSVASHQLECERGRNCLQTHSLQQQSSSTVHMGCRLPLVVRKYFTCSRRSTVVLCCPQLCMYMFIWEYTVYPPGGLFSQCVCPKTTWLSSNLLKGCSLGAGRNNWTWSFGWTNPKLQVWEAHLCSSGYCSETEYKIQSMDNSWHTGKSCPLEEWSSPF